MTPFGQSPEGPKIPEDSPKLEQGLERGDREIGTLDLTAMKQLVREYYEKNKMDTSVLDRINIEG